MVADYSLVDESLLPVGRVHLATLHLVLEGEPDFDLRLITATTPEGRAIAYFTAKLPPISHESCHPLHGKAATPREVDSRRV